MYDGWCYTCWWTHVQSVIKNLRFVELPNVIIFNENELKLFSLEVSTPNTFGKLFDGNFVVMIFRFLRNWYVTDWRYPLHYFFFFFGKQNSLSLQVHRCPSGATHEIKNNFFVVLFNLTRASAEKKNQLFC